MKKEMLEKIIRECKEGDIVEVTEVDNNGWYSMPNEPAGQLITKCQYFAYLAINPYGDGITCGVSNIMCNGNARPGYELLNPNKITDFKIVRKKDEGL